MAKDYARQLEDDLRGLWSKVPLTAQALEETRELKWLLHAHGDGRSALSNLERRVLFDAEKSQEIGALGAALGFGLEEYEHGNVTDRLSAFARRFDRAGSRSARRWAEDGAAIFADRIAHMHPHSIRGRAVIGIDGDGLVVTVHPPSDIQDSYLVDTYDHGQEHRVGMLETSLNGVVEQIDDYLMMRNPAKYGAIRNATDVRIRFNWVGDLAFGVEVGHEVSSRFDVEVMSQPTRVDVTLQAIAALEQPTLGIVESP